MRHGASWEGSLGRKSPRGWEVKGRMLPERKIPLGGASQPQAGHPLSAMFEDGDLPEDGDSKHEAGVMTPLS